MSGFASYCTSLQLVPDEPMFGIYTVPVDRPVLRQNLRIVKVDMVRSNFIRSSLLFFSGAS